MRARAETRAGVASLNAGHLRRLFELSSRVNPEARRTSSRPSTCLCSAMSAITFPNGFPSHSSSSMHEDATYDMLGSASGFQMNPLSAHPPRTPHTSISVASPPSITYNSADIYTSTEENEEKPEDIEEEVAEAHRELREGSKPGSRRVRREDVWREILKSSTGRDKALVGYIHTILVLPNMNEHALSFVRKSSNIPSRYTFSFTRL